MSADGHSWGPNAMTFGLGLIVLCGILALVYGGVTVSQVMAASAGSARCRRFPAPSREGAQAYLKRQYTTIAGVGVVVFIGLGLLLSWTVAIGFLIGAVLSGAAGFIGMNVSVRANVRTAQAATQIARPPASTSPSRPARSPACWSPASRCSASPAISGCSPGRSGYAPVRPRRRRLAGRARLRRLADLDLRPSRRRHLHQGRRRRRRSRRQGRGRHPRGRSAQPRDDRRQCRRQCRRLRRHGGRSVRDLRRDGGRDDGARLDLLRRQGQPRRAMLYPLAICGACIVTSIIGTFFVKLGANNSIMGALYKGLIVTGLLSIVGLARRDAVVDRLGRDRRRRRQVDDRRQRCSSAASSASS